MSQMTGDFWHPMARAPQAHVLYPGIPVPVSG